MKISFEDIIPPELLERCYPLALTVAFYAIYSVWYGPWGAFSLVCLCGICVSGSRLWQSEFIRRFLRENNQQATVGTARKNAFHVVMALLVLLLVQVLVSPDTPFLLVSRWYLLLVMPLLTMAFEFVSTPRAELSEALAKSQTNYAQGAAWGFFLGYLMIRFGHGHGTQGEQNVPSFAKRMSDYETSEELDEQRRTQTYKRRMIILVPMKHEALLSDTDFSVCDESVRKENKLPGIKDGGRTYGETQVYTIQDGDDKYRVAMEEATPIRTAALAVDDSAAQDFDKEDFEEFARRFLTDLQTILCSKPGIRDQVELVPIENMSRVGSTVVQRIRKLEELNKSSPTERQMLADRLTAAGSVASRQPEQQALP